MVSCIPSSASASFCRRVSRIFSKVYRVIHGLPGYLVLPLVIPSMLLQLQSLLSVPFASYPSAGLKIQIQIRADVLRHPVARSRARPERDSAMVIAWDTFLLSVADTDAQWLCRAGGEEKGRGEEGYYASGQALISGILKRIFESKRSGSSSNI